MEREGFMGTPKGPAMYVKNTWTCHDFVEVCFREDHCVAVGSWKERTELTRSVDAKYSLGEGRWVLGMLLECDPPNDITGGIHWLHFNLTDAITVATPLTPGTPPSTTDCPTSKDEIEEMVNWSCMELVGALAWLVLGTRPHVAFAPSELARLGHNPVGRG